MIILTLPYEYVNALNFSTNTTKRYGYRRGIYVFLLLKYLLKIC